LALTFDMISAFHNVPLGLGKVIFEQNALHAPQRPATSKRSFREILGWNVRFGSKADMSLARSISSQVG
jgi:hypothetical protein